MSITIKDSLLYYKSEMINCFNDNIGCYDELGDTGITPLDFKIKLGNEVIECANSQLTSDSCSKAIKGDVVYKHQTIQKQDGEDNMDINSMINSVSDAGIGAVIVYILLGLWLTTAFKFVGEKRAIVYKWFGGKYATTLNAGFNIKFPYPIYTAYREVGLEQFEISREIGVKTSDNAFLRIPVNLQLKVIKGKEKESVFELDDFEEQLFSYVYGAILNVANGMEMDDIFTSKDKFEEAVEKLKDQFEGYGFEVVKVLIEDPKVSDQLTQSFEDVLAAKRKEEAAQYNANAEMIELVGTAKAKSEAMSLTATGVANARNIIAKGNSNAIAVMRGLKTMEVVIEEKDVVVDGKKVKQATEVVKYTDVQNPTPSDISDIDVLNFLNDMNKIEGWKEASRSGSTVIISDRGNGNSGSILDMSKAQALIEASKK